MLLVMRFSPILLIAGAATAGALALSCGGGEESDASGGSAASTTASAPIPPESQAKFDTLCSTCHGKTGKGEGAAAAALNPKPRNYTDKAWQKSVTDERLAKAIVEGGPAVGLSALMPPNPDLKDKPEVVAGLVQIIRNFGK